MLEKVSKKMSYEGTNKRGTINVNEFCDKE